ncbi:hypothetical protein C1646_497281 [Rhizophagus diaphanus]|nr:hypothetical protein C1646_497281 [Rhizophagus diaphanus] [Rhizophagus sp. MUCL 43196]
MDITTIKSYSLGYALECRDPKEHKISRSHSLSISESSAKSFTWDEEDSLLCPYNALQCLLNRTQTWRNDPKNKYVLFLISKLPQATDTIANWIKSVVKLSSPNSSAKDIIICLFLTESRRLGNNISIMQLV